MRLHKKGQVSKAAKHIFTRMHMNTVDTVNASSTLGWLPVWWGEGGGETLEGEWSKRE